MKQKLIAYLGTITNLDKEELDATSDAIIEWHLESFTREGAVEDCMMYGYSEEEGNRLYEIVCGTDVLV